MNKFLYSDVGSDIKGYETRMIPWMLVIFKVKKAIDVMPLHEKKTLYHVRKKLDDFFLNCH